MPENIVHSRKPIHDRTTSQWEESDEDELPFDDSQDPWTSKSDSDLEKSGESIHYGRPYVPEKYCGMSRSVSRTPQRTNNNPAKVSPVYHCTQGSKTSSPFWLISLVILGSVLIYFCMSKVIVAEDRSCSFEDFRKQYPKESPNLWNRLKVGIESILNKKTQKPAVYLFANNGGKDALQLIKDTAAHSSDCFGKKLIPMESDDFISTPGILEDYGHAIEKYRNKIKEGNVILIANLNEIPAEAARALHTICDTHSPIAKNAVIYLALTIQGNKDGNADAIAEETLIDLWGSKLPRNELDPLITRVTDQVIILKS